MTQSLARDAWMAACQFHALSDSIVLKEILDRVKGHESRPAVLLDLDSTLYEVRPRTFRILQEWSDSEHSSRFPVARASIKKMTESEVGYSVRDTFTTLGLDLKDSLAHAAWESAKQFWSKRFFTDAYLQYDRPYPGAALFAQELHRHGAEVVYLTGRDSPNMEKGTIANFVRDGFPWRKERVHLLLKPSTSIIDLDHKMNAVQFVQAKGQLVASFENEPLNIVALYRAFPDAMHVFMDTVCSDHAAEPLQGLYRIRGFGSP